MMTLRTSLSLPDLITAVFVGFVLVASCYYAWIADKPYLVVGLNIGLYMGAVAMMRYSEIRNRIRSKNRQHARKQREQDATAAPHVRKSRKANGFFEVVGGTDQKGKPYKTYFTQDYTKAERMAAERMEGIIA